MVIQIKSEKMTILYFFIVFFSFVANIIGGWVIYRFAKRLFTFDDLFEMLLHDLDVNISYFKEIQSSPLLSNAQEVVEADRNMRIMRIRLEEYALRIEDISSKRRKNKEPINPPVVV